MQRVWSREQVPGDGALAAATDFEFKVFSAAARNKPRLSGFPRDAVSTPSTLDPKVGPEDENPRGWRIPNHFVNCSNFEQSLLKLMTKQKRWSTNALSGLPYGSSLVVQVSGGAQARTSSVTPSIKIKSNFRGNRVDTIFRAGLLALLFFCLEQVLFGARLLALLFFSFRSMRCAASRLPARLPIH